MMNADQLTTAAQTFAQAETAVAKARKEHEDLKGRIENWSRSPIMIFGRMFDLTEDLKTVLLDQTGQDLFDAQVRRDAALNLLLTSAGSFQFKGLPDAP